MRKVAHDELFGEFDNLVGSDCRAEGGECFFEPFDECLPPAHVVLDFEVGAVDVAVDIDDAGVAGEVVVECGGSCSGGAKLEVESEVAVAEFVDVDEGAVVEDDASFLEAGEVSCDGVDAELRVAGDGDDALPGVCGDGAEDGVFIGVKGEGWCFCEEVAVPVLWGWFSEEVAFRVVVDVDDGCGVGGGDEAVVLVFQVGQEVEELLVCSAPENDVGVPVSPDSEGPRNAGVSEHCVEESFLRCGVVAGEFEEDAEAGEAESCDVDFCEVTPDDALLFEAVQAVGCNSPAGPRFLRDLLDCFSRARVEGVEDVPIERINSHGTNQHEQ